MEFKRVGLHYTDTTTADYAWRYRQRGRNRQIRSKIAKILRELRNLG